MLLRNDWLRKKLPLLNSLQSPWCYSKAAKPWLCPSEQGVICLSHAPSRQPRAVLHQVWLIRLGAPFRSKLELLVWTHSSLPLQVEKGSGRWNFFTAVPHPASHCHPSTPTGFSERDKKSLTWTWGNARAKVFPRLYKSQNV